MEIIRFLKKEEICGKYYSVNPNIYRLNIFNDELDMDAKAFATDLAALMGVVEETYPEFIDEEGNEIPYAPYYTYDMDGKNEMNYIVDGFGDIMLTRLNDKTIGCRPVIAYSLIKNYCQTEVLDDGTLIAYFGRYPQRVVNNLEQYALTKRLNENKLNKLDKTYTLDGKTHEVYECNNRKFIQYTSEKESESVLSNYETIQKGKTYWVEIEPIMWLVDKEKDVAVANNVLFGGMEFSKNERYFFDEFEESNVGRYLNNEFLNEITEYAKLIRIEAEKMSVKKELQRLSQKQEENSEEYVRIIFKEKVLC